mmetsp:Transcript_12216/g.25798  ORF Transcript_12216/g.25798 Transcript_12216/m.25798 type:complete len:220 (-) Transcript_12216:110-769(-)
MFLPIKLNFMLITPTTTLRLLTTLLPPSLHFTLLLLLNPTNNAKPQLCRTVLHQVFPLEIHLMMLLELLPQVPLISHMFLVLQQIHSEQMHSLVEQLHLLQPMVPITTVTLITFRMKQTFGKIWDLESTPAVMPTITLRLPTKPPFKHQAPHPTLQTPRVTPNLSKTKSPYYLTQTTSQREENTTLLVSPSLSSVLSSPLDRNFATLSTVLHPIELLTP